MIRPKMDGNEIFWQKIEFVLKCTVPEHIKRALDRTGYINPALEDLTVEGINAIEADIRELPPEDPDVRIFLGINNRSISSFKLMSGERALLMKMSKAVKTKGWPFFTKKRNQRSGTNDRKNVDEVALRTRIIDYYQQRNDQSEEHANILQTLPSVSIRFDDEVHNRFYVSCALCSKMVTCNTEKSGEWKISNYVAHIKKHRTNSLNPAKKRKIDANVAMETAQPTDDEECQPYQPQRNQHETDTSYEQLEKDLSTAQAKDQPHEPEKQRHQECLSMNPNASPNHTDDDLSNTSAEYLEESNLN